jgi:GT2 family glycosyltransferase
MTAPVAIIVLTWNAVAYTRKCLERLRSVTEHPAYRVIVVDNGSHDGTVEYLQGLDWITLIANDKNLGYTKANNQGLAATRPDEDVVLLNNDIDVDDPAWLTKLQDAAYSADDVGVVGTRLVDTDGRINHLGSYMAPVTLYGEQVGGLELDINQCIRRKSIECVVFAMAYLRRTCIDAIGPLDEDFFAYFEDTEYCFRATKAGFQVLYAGDVCPIHHHNTSTRENKVDFWGIYEESRKVFRRKWGQWVDHDRYDVDVVWHSVMHRPLGYAMHSRQMMSALNADGVRVSYTNAYGGHDEQPDSRLLGDFMRRKPGPGARHVAYAQCDAFPRVKGSPRIGWSMLEVTGLPADWVAGCNSMDEVWVPASFNVETFRNSGVTVPIRVMPLGVDVDYLHPGIKPYRPSSRFTFLSIFEWGERKAPEVLLEAYANEFKPSDDVLLLVSVFNADPTIDVEVEVAKLNLPPSAPIALMVNPEFAFYEMGALYRSADAFVLPTRGEGFGVPVLEAMACGLPTIATNWSGPADFLHEGVGYPLESRLIPAVARCPYYEGFEWADPDVDHLRALMRHVVDHPEEARAKGAAAAAEVAAKHTWQIAARRVHERLLEIG